MCSFAYYVNSKTFTLAGFQRKYLHTFKGKFGVLESFILRPGCTETSQYILRTLRFPGGSDGKESACNSGDPDSTPGSGRPAGEGNGNPLQYSCLENPKDGGAWRATVLGVAKSRHD